MKKFKYHSITARLNCPVNQELNELGSQGWELVSSYVDKDETSDYKLVHILKIEINE